MCIHTGDELTRLREILLPPPPPLMTSMSRLWNIFVMALRLCWKSLDLMICEWSRLVINTPGPFFGLLPESQWHYLRIKTCKSRARTLSNSSFLPLIVSQHCCLEWFFPFWSVQVKMTSPDPSEVTHQGRTSKANQLYTEQNQAKCYTLTCLNFQDKWKSFESVKMT